MPISRRQEALALFLGDIFFLGCALFLTLIVRYGYTLDWYVIGLHIVPFSFLFLTSTLVFLIAGLYEKHTLLMKSRLPQTIFFTQCANLVIAAAFFFLMPFFQIQPKAFLFVYLLFSTTTVSLWRMYLAPVALSQTQEPALMVGEGDVANDVYEEVNGNTRYAIRFDGRLSADAGAEEILKEARRVHTAVVVMPLPLMRSPEFTVFSQALAREDIRIVDVAALYEELFDRVALSLLDERGLAEAELPETFVYTVLKRIMDVVLSALALVVLAPVFLVTFVLLRLDGGRAVIAQERIGRNGRIIKILKFRTMLFDDAGDPEKQKGNRVTALGAILRKWQIDEIPQFWNVLLGDLSLIGPRPEIPSLVAEYEKQIPFYAARHMIQPGISGWAQIKHASPPKWKLNVEATRNKLSYDVYYLKHRSLMVDIVVALRTIQILLSRVGI